MPSTSPIISNELKAQLQREIPHLAGEIHMLYMRLDRQFGLHGAEVPVTFGYETDVLGSYTSGGEGKQEHFHFSLLYIGYLDMRQIRKKDKIDLYKHEYAHYMAENMEIPDRYHWQGGKHGSAWKYCCSLIGAAPTAYFEENKSLQKHDYKRTLDNPWKNPNYSMLDSRRQQKEIKRDRDRQVRYQEGDAIRHPVFGEGTVEKVKQMEGDVRMTVRFSDGLHTISQKWLIAHTDARFRGR